MITPTPPSATDALQKAGETVDMEKLLLELQSYLSKVHPKRIFTVIPEIVSHLRSQASELERVTAERDAALKGYRGMREVIGEIDHSHRCDIRTDGTGCNCHMIRVKAVLTSFPEIK